MKGFIKLTERSEKPIQLNISHISQIKNKELVMLNDSSNTIEVVETIKEIESLIESDLRFSELKEQRDEATNLLAEIMELGIGSKARERVIAYLLKIEDWEQNLLR